MTPEQRETLAALIHEVVAEHSATMEHGHTVYHKCWCGKPGHPDEHRADALTPLIDEMLRQAAETAWDEGWAAMGNEAVSPACAEINPYRDRKATT